MQNVNTYSKDDILWLMFVISIPILSCPLGLINA